MQICNDYALAVHFWQCSRKRGPPLKKT